MSHQHYCTYFDRNYLANGLALHASLVRHAPPFTLWVLCLDDETYAALTALALPGVRPLALAELEDADPELLAVKPTRSRVEYYFTSTPSLVRHVLDRAADADAVTYVDADLGFFDDPAPIYAELVGHDVLIVEHRFPPRLQHMAERFGTYNVGLVAFRRSPAAQECLGWWRERCLEWCYDAFEPGRFGDQKYLDEWPARFSGVRVLAHKGAGVGPWNVSGYRLERKGGRTLVDGEPLLFYHFHGLSPLNRWLYYTALATYGNRLNGMLRRHVYAPYVRDLQRAGSQLRGLDPGLAVTRRPRMAVSSPRVLPGLALTGQLLLVVGPLAL